MHTWVKKYGWYWLYRPLQRGDRSATTGVKVASSASRSDQDLAERRREARPAGLADLVDRPGRGHDGGSRAAAPVAARCWWIDVGAMTIPSRM